MPSIEVAASPGRALLVTVTNCHHLYVSRPRTVWSLGLPKLLARKAPKVDTSTAAIAMLNRIRETTYT